MIYNYILNLQIKRQLIAACTQRDKSTTKAHNKNDVFSEPSDKFLK